MKTDKVLFLFGIILLLSLATPDGYSGDDHHSRLRVNVAYELSYVEHARIVIRNNTDFTYQASIENWDGDGSSDTPYIIEGYNITDDLSCIDITHVSVHFVIRNCFLNSTTGPWDPGIYFYNASHARVESTFITWHTYGIYAHLCPDVVIYNCTVTESNANTIWIIDSERAKLFDSKVFDNSYRIYIQNSDYVEIVNNEIHDNGWQGLMIESSNFLNLTGNNIANNGVSGYFGIDLFLCNNASFQNNEILDNSYAGLHIYSSHNAALIDNTISRNGLSSGDYGFYAEFSNYSKLVDNQIYDNGFAGVYLDNSHHGYFLSNDIYNNSDFGIELAVADDTTILDNDIWDNGKDTTDAGLRVISSDELYIEQNRIWNNWKSGIDFSSSMFSTVSTNEIFNNSDFGITGSNCHDFTISGNQVYSNGWNLGPLYPGGINFFGNNWRIEDNTIWNNTEYGISFEGDNNTVISNKIWNCKRSGIGFFECYDNIITGNTVFNCDYGIELVSIGSNITNNIVYDNDYGIYMISSGDCRIYQNDFGWNGINAVEIFTFPSMEIFWYNNVTDVGNWWNDYNGVGSYGITNGTHFINYDLYPSKSLDLDAPASQDFEFQETGNVMLWPAQALNPSHFEVYSNGSLLYSDSWDGTDIETNLEDLAVGHHIIMLIVYHVSGHSINTTSSADVTDTTAPSWISAPTSQQITVGQSFSYQVTATDVSGIGGYSVNDTAQFQISATGLITNMVPLEIGVYGLEITVVDSYGNELTSTITITVVVATPDGLDPIMLIVLGASAGVIILIIAMVVYGKKRG
ncbi:MAG: right-handed parallel beta-helix repeat-containing protein [Candidatus Sifarchaeia archaeon]